MKKLLFSITAFGAMQLAVAQTKVFKEVSEEVSSEMKTIRQDGALVGYLVFTQLEKASADSFNYKLSILDENLNDIGSLNFKEERLKLEAVAFDQDVLCLAYVKSNLVGNEFKSFKQYKKAVKSDRNFVYTQFITLEGKIINKNQAKVAINPGTPYRSMSNLGTNSKLKHGIQLRNIANKGFAIFYGDEDRNSLFLYNFTGNQVWQTTVKEHGEDFGLLTSGQNIHLLLKRETSSRKEGGFELLGYSTDDFKSFPKYVLRDKKGSELKVLAFDNDPATGKPYITGNILNANGRHGSLTAKQVAGGTYTGVFTINVNGPKKTDIVESFSYWADGSQTFVNRKGYYIANGTYARQSRSFRDFEGNTYFIGSSFKKKPRWGVIAASVITAPLLFPPLYILSDGTSKAKVSNVTLLKQTVKGELSVESYIPCKESMYYPAGRASFDIYDQRSYENVHNSEKKTSYVVVNDSKQISIYSIGQKKVVRTIPYDSGDTRTSVYAAKEGHILVSEYNIRERVTRFSIESL